MAFSSRQYLTVLAASVLALGPLAGCGGGGGDDREGILSGDVNFVGAATVEIDATPRNIDTGDRTEIVVDISDVHEDGILLKIRFPEGLRYVPGSTHLLADRSRAAVRPIANETAASGIYLVYSFDQSDFGERVRGKLVFQLEATDALERGDVEVDADVRTEQAFNIETPLFGAEAGVEIEVTG